jgi:hypothetical protein
MRVSLISTGYATFFGGLLMLGAPGRPARRRTRPPIRKHAVVPVIAVDPAFAVEKGSYVSIPK